MRFGHRSWRLLTLCIAIAGCANIDSISRTTPLPKESAGGLAIHLDAKQRLVYVNSIQKVCAEPSPDALAAFASSLGFGGSAPSQGTVSLAQAIQGSAGSIGLRTQSITLMRDALYRVCEAYANGGIGAPQIMTLLARSQDVTAVILAVEQLTGAVAANQVILTGTAGAGASGSLLANQELLDAARKNEEQKAKDLEAAKAARDELKTQAAEAQTAVDVAKAVYDKSIAPGSTATEEERARLKSELDQKIKTRDDLNAKLAAAEENVTTTAALLAEAKQTRETIENMRNAALTNAVANTTTAGQFSPVVQRNQLSKGATEAISMAVVTMVTKVLDKDYTLDSCVALVTNPPIKDYGDAYRKALDDAREQCVGLIRASVEKQIRILRSTQ